MRAALILQWGVIMIYSGGGLAGPIEAAAGEASVAERVVVPAEQDARLTPVTLGDAVIEAFLEKGQGVLQRWRVDKSTAPDAKLAGGWAVAHVTWTASKAGVGPTLTREYAAPGVALGPYTRLVVSAGFPEGTHVTLRAQTDAGAFETTHVCEVSHTDQHVLPMPGSRHLQRIDIALGAAEPGEARGKLVWVGVRDAQLAAMEKRRWQMFADQPLDVYLRDKPAPADAMPLCNILCPAEDFAAARETRRQTDPEPLELRLVRRMGPHLFFANDKLFGRRGNEPGQTFEFSPEGGKTRPYSLVDAARDAALAGDEQAMREVAKGAVFYAMVPHWDVDFVTQFPGGSWEQRSFAQAHTAYEVAVAYDLCGAYLSNSGRALVLRRLAEDALGNLNFVVWRHAYIFRCNQLPVFSAGRLAAYAALEKAKDYAHIAPYTDLAASELNESLAHIFEKDGGFPEGSAYLAYTLGTALPALAIYGNARQRPLGELLPPLLAGTDDYIEALRSLENPGALILLADAQGGPFASISPSVLSVMAKIRPGGAAARLLARQGSGEALSNKIDLWALPAPNMEGVNPDFYEPFVRLPSSGLASSARKIDGRWAKLLVVGGPALAGHNHEDRGSFVLEFGGEGFAVDPGGLLYADAASSAMSYAQHHNMLVPLSGKSPRPAPKNPAPVAVIPEARGDKMHFETTLDPGVLWPEYYKAWSRSFDWPSGNEIVIRDKYELQDGVSQGVAFLWHTPLPLEIQGGQVVVRGKNARVVITPANGMEVEIEGPRKLGTRELSTLRLLMRETSGTLETRVALTAIESD